jgi:hypothetical protein
MDHGIENLKKILKVLAELANLGDDIGRDTSSGRWAKLLNLVDIVRNFGTLDLSQVVPEFQDLTAEERKQLIAELKDELALGDKKLEMAIEEGLAVVEDFAEVLQRAVAVVKEARA